MQIITTRHLSDAQLERIRELWNTEYPKVIAHATPESFTEYLNRLDDIVHRLVIDDDGQILGWYMDFLRDGERWFVMVIGENAQHQGFGSELLKMGLDEQPVLNGWVVSSSIYEKANGEIYMSPLSFYIKHGVRVYPDIRFETEKIRSIKIRLQRSAAEQVSQPAGH